MTTSVFEIIGLAENRAMQFDLPFPKENPKLLITVRRMPQTFVNSAQFLADGNLRERHVAFGDPAWGALNYARLCYEIVEFMKTHATGWRAVDGSELKEPCNSVTVSRWVDELELLDRQDLGRAYFKAVEEDQKKLTPAASGDQDSSTPSENGSSTT